MKEAAIIIENITKKFEDATAVDGLNLVVEKGELFGLLGPNGAGKTTTINILYGRLQQKLFRYDNLQIVLRMVIHRSKRPLKICKPKPMCYHAFNV